MGVLAQSYTQLTHKALVVRCWLWTKEIGAMWGLLTQACPVRCTQVLSKILWTASNWRQCPGLTVTVGASCRRTKQTSFPSGVTFYASLCPLCKPQLPMQFRREWPYPLVPRRLDGMGHRSAFPSQYLTASHLRLSPR